MRNMTVRSFADPSTHFALLHHPTRVDPQGRHTEPTGELVCCECGEMAENVDEIRHMEWCGQRGVHSRYWRRTHDGE